MFFAIYTYFVKYDELPSEYTYVYILDSVIKNCETKELLHCLYKNSTATEIEDGYLLTSEANNAELISSFIEDDEVLEVINDRVGDGFVGSNSELVIKCDKNFILQSIKLKYEDIKIIIKIKQINNIESTINLGETISSKDFNKYFISEY